VQQPQQQTPPLQPPVQQPLSLPSSLVPVQQPQQQTPPLQPPVQQPLSLPSSLVPVQQLGRKAANKLLADLQKQADDDAACERSRAFMAAGGRYDFREPQEPAQIETKEPETKEVLVVTSGDEGAGLPDERDYDADDRGFHLGSSASDAAANKDGKRKTAWRYEAGQGYATGHEVEAPDDEDINEGGKNKQGGRKTTHWVHRTKITCLRLIQRMNPWAAKDSGLMWQQIAD
jgi:hypothetical protein